MTRPSRLNEEEHPMQQQYHVAIIGGGFSGTALAINLIRLAERPVQITLVEERDRLGRGLAYSTTVESHVLNTRVGNMSLFSDAPGLFKHWLETSGTEAPESAFAPRASYGDYIEDTLIESIAMHQEDSAEFTACLQTRATAITRRSGRFDVSLDDGRTLRSDAVVIATGNPAPADPLAAWLGPLTSRYLRDAWDQDRIARIAPTDRVLILGTGLTMIDVVLALKRNGHTGAVHAMSRRGLLPRVHGAALQELPGSLRESLHSAARSRNLRILLGAMRDTIRLADERHISWHSVIDALRPITSELWAELPDRERRRFTRHLQAYWDVHRHRLPPESARTIADLQQDGSLIVTAGRVRGAAETRHSIAVERQLRGDRHVQNDAFDRVINCTGPRFGGEHGSSLHDQLIASGMLTPDALGLGYNTAANGLSLGTDGPVEGLYVLGPACKARDWEHTAVPELRASAELLATELLQCEGSRKRSALQRMLPSTRAAPFRRIAEWLPSP
jgi:uncharacterized NAD(P)/FAD-binding protein YdhS